MRGVTKLDQLKPDPPYTARWRAWLAGAEPTAVAAELIRTLAPKEPGALELLFGGTAAREFASRFGTIVQPADLGPVLEQLQSGGFVLRWPATAAPPQLEVLCSLYDDNLEIQTGPALRARTETALHASLAGGA
jgi:hypothetical protein